MTDVLVIGGGTAGCVVARRLAEAGAEVHLVEAGIDTPPGGVPADIGDLYPRSYYNAAYMWPGLSADQGGDGRGRKTPFVQARVMGGGSSLMGMCAVRGLPADYDGWAGLGATGWAWDDVLSSFRRLERDLDVDGPLHGQGGPVTISRVQPNEWPPFSQAIGLVARRCGWSMEGDMNGMAVDGYFPLPLSRTATARVSAASAYLDPVTRERPNLTIEGNATVERLLFEGSRCIGATVVTGGRRRTLRADRVVLSAGAVHSPALLMRSGIGPDDHLRQLGIPVVVPSPGVGDNLQNHPVAYLATHLRPEARQSEALRAQFTTALRFSADGSAPGTGDLMLLVVNRSAWHDLGQAIAGLGVCLMQPHSRGTVRLVRPDLGASPDVRFRMLTDQRDLERMAYGLGQALALLRSPEVRHLRNELFVGGYTRIVRRLNRPGRGSEHAAGALARLLDGPGLLRRALLTIGGAPLSEGRMTRPSWLEHTARQRSFGTYHPAGTCRMGAVDDPGAVVDPSCAVLGTDRLHVVDASVMPTIVRGNTNLPVTMIAEHAADGIVARASGAAGAPPAAGT